MVRSIQRDGSAAASAGVSSARESRLVHPRPACRLRDVGRGLRARKRLERRELRRRGPRLGDAGAQHQAHRWQQRLHLGLRRHGHARAGIALDRHRDRQRRRRGHRLGRYVRLGRRRAGALRAHAHFPGQPGRRAEVAGARRILRQLPSLGEAMRKVWSILAIAFPLLVQAQSYPARPVRLVVPFPPGGSVDVVARALTPKLSERIGQQVVIENRSGASGIIGTEGVAHANPDGYTLLINTIPFVTNTYLYSKLPYDPFTDFLPVTWLCSSPGTLVINPSVPARSVRELLQLAKSKPGALNYSAAGAGTNPHLTGELFNYLGNVDIVAVQYKGGRSEER